MSLANSLRPYQQDCLDKCLDNQGGLCILPTGSGKSHIIAELCHNLKDVLVITPRRELVIQNKAKIKNDTLVCTINLAYIRKIYKPILIIDEAHLIKSKDGMYQQLIKHADIVYGFTATPFRLDIGFLVPRIFKSVIYEVERETLCPEYLTPRKMISIPQKLLINVKGFNSLPKMSEEVCPQTKQCLDHFLSIKIGKSLIFGCDIKHCDEIKKIIPDSKIVSSFTKTNDRKQIIDGFKRGEIHNLINCELLTTGYDDPNISNICILRPTDSYTLHEQILGRGDRIYPGKQYNNIYDYTLNSYNFKPRPNGNPFKYCIFCMKITDYRLKKCSNCNRILVRGETPKKTCPSCKHKNFNISTYCTNCGQFIRKNVNRINANSITVRQLTKDRACMKIRNVKFNIKSINLKSFIKLVHSDVVYVERQGDEFIYSNLKPFCIYWKTAYMDRCPYIIKLALVD